MIIPAHAPSRIYGKSVEQHGCCVMMTRLNENCVPAASPRASRERPASRSANGKALAREQSETCVCCLLNQSVNNSLGLSVESCATRRRIHERTSPWRAPRDKSTSGNASTGDARGRSRSCPSCKCRRDAVLRREGDALLYIASDHRRSPAPWDVGVRAAELAVMLEEPAPVLLRGLVPQDGTSRRAPPDRLRS